MMFVSGMALGIILCMVVILLRNRPVQKEVLPPAEAVNLPNHVSVSNAPDYTRKSSVSRPATFTGVSRWPNGTFGGLSREESEDFQ